MLARVNRIVLGEDYRATVRRGMRCSGEHALLYIRPSGEGTVRFGFIVAKTVGNAVQRNLVRRRLKNIAYTLLPSLPHGADIVVRALPGAAQASWTTLSHEITRALVEGVARI